MNAYSAGKHLYCSAIWSAGFVLALLTGCISDQKIPKVVVETEPLSTQDMVKYPAWQPTDPIPLSPDAAVVIGWKWILTNTKDCDAGSEPKVMDIRLCELSEGRWFYTVLYGVRLTGGGTRCRSPACGDGPRARASRTPSKGRRWSVRRRSERLYSCRSASIGTSFDALRAG